MEQSVEGQDGARLDVRRRVTRRSGHRPHRLVPVADSPLPLWQVVERRLCIDAVLPANACCLTYCQIGQVPVQPWARATRSTSCCPSLGSGSKRLGMPDRTACLAAATSKYVRVLGRRTGRDVRSRGSGGASPFPVERAQRRDSGHAPRPVDRVALKGTLPQRRYRTRRLTRPLPCTCPGSYGVGHLIGGVHVGVNR